jgi:hypothetical protein
MNKKLLLICSLFSGIGFSQTFTATNAPQIGESQTMYMCDSSFTSYENVTGNGVTWDYSGAYKLPLANPLRTYSISANNDLLNYPSANQEIAIEGILTNYVNSSSTGRVLYGFKYIEPTFGTISTNYSSGDPLNYMEYDFTLNEIINDLFSGTISATQVDPNMTGSSKSVVDGVGTLKLSPSITKTNITRHHLIDTVNATTIFGPVKVIFNQFEYFDLNNTTNRLPLFNYTNVKLITPIANFSFNFVLNSIDPVGYVGINEIEKDNFVIFPSPAKNTITVSSDKFSGNELFEISTLEGKVILNSTSNNINVSVLPTGMYVVAVNINGELIKQKFIKE